MENVIEIVFTTAVSFVVIFGAILAGIKFMKMPKEDQISQVQKWLLYAVKVAENELGSKTGILKLSKVYGMFVLAFPFLVDTLSFTKFEDMVKKALKEIEGEAKKNSFIAKAFYGSEDKK